MDLIPLFHNLNDTLTLMTLMTPMNWNYFTFMVSMKLSSRKSSPFWEFGLPKVGVSLAQSQGFLSPKIQKSQTFVNQTNIKSPQKRDILLKYFDTTPVPKSLRLHDYSCNRNHFGPKQGQIWAEIRLKLRWIWHKIRGSYSRSRPRKMQFLSYLIEIDGYFETTQIFVSVKLRPWTSKLIVLFVWSICAFKRFAAYSSSTTSRQPEELYTFASPSKS